MLHEGLTVIMLLAAAAVGGGSNEWLLQLQLLQHAANAFAVDYCFEGAEPTVPGSQPSTQCQAGNFSIRLYSTDNILNFSHLHCTSASEAVESTGGTARCTRCDRACYWR
jgi:hypothetical protein